MMAEATAGTPAISVRRARFEDRARLLDFYAQHHSQRSRLTDGVVWDWLFTQQPDASSEPPLYVLEVDGDIAGGIGYIGADVLVAGQKISGILPINYFINPAFRGLPALRLLRAALDGRTLAIGAYVSPDARRLLLKFGFVDLSAALRSYHYGLQVRGNIRSAATWSLRRSVELLRRGTRKLLYPELAHRISTVLDRQFLESCRSELGLHRLEKSFEWLNWRYVQSPLLNSTTFHVEFVYQFRGGHPVAMAIIGKDMARRELVILDVIWHTDALLGALIDEVIARGRIGRCDVVSTHALSAPLHKIFVAGFFASSVSNVGMVVLARDPALREEATDPARWHFMIGDCDAY